jgi:AraC-like DNA-binding protein
MLSRPKPADLKPYQTFFGLKLHFNAEQTGALLPLSLLDRCVPGADPDLRKALEDRVAAYWRAGDLDIVTRLRRVLRIALLTGQDSGEKVAAHLSFHRRTLHRRLKAHSTTFQEVLDETRFEFAQQLLTARG